MRIVVDNISTGDSTSEETLGGMRMHLSATWMITGAWWIEVSQMNERSALTMLQELSRQERGFRR